MLQDPPPKATPALVYRPPKRRQRLLLLALQREDLYVSHTMAISAEPRPGLDVSQTLLQEQVRTLFLAGFN
jgi:hypothetical protein